MPNRTIALFTIIAMALFTAYAAPSATNSQPGLRAGLATSVRIASEISLFSPGVASAEEERAADVDAARPMYLLIPLAGDPQPAGPMPEDSGAETAIGGQTEDSDPEPAVAEEPEEVAEEEAVEPEEEPAPASREVSDRSGANAAVTRVTTSPPQTGLATYYHPSLEGGRMANGRPYHSWAMTAASNSYPLGTLLRVTYLKSVVVEVTDRGSFGHALDLSSGAFQAIAGSLGPGIIRVTIEVMGRAY